MQFNVAKVFWKSQSMAYLPSLSQFNLCFANSWNSLISVTKTRFIILEEKNPDTTLGFIVWNLGDFYDLYKNFLLLPNCIVSCSSKLQRFLYRFIFSNRQNTCLLICLATFTCAPLKTLFFNKNCLRWLSKPFKYES